MEANNFLKNEAVREGVPGFFGGVNNMTPICGASIPDLIDIQNYQI